jgi:polysaccharide deacetylase family protein (PEP-CTERM system associated)
MHTIFDIIDSADVKATFFVVGWIAEKHPNIVKEITYRGFEIGSHTHLHQLVYDQDRNSFFKDVEKSIKTIEDITGKKVRSFRAPGFSITRNNKWAFEVLNKLGIEIDASIFPTKRAHGGFTNYEDPKPSILKYNGIKLKEFPINTYNILGKPIIFSGGGYFRLLPYSLIKSFTNKSDYVMTYFHPRDFDYKQPIIPGLSPIRLFKSYFGLKKCQPKLENWLNDFDFIDIETANREIDWSNVKTIEL